VVTGSFPKMGPVPHPDLSASRHHCLSAPGAFTRKTWLGFSALSINVSKFYFDTPRIAADVQMLAASRCSGSRFADGGGRITAWSFLRPVSPGILTSWPIKAKRIAY
jgi:hypothetical protein